MRAVIHFLNIVALYSRAIASSALLFTVGSIGKIQTAPPSVIRGQVPEGTLGAPLERLKPRREISPLTQVQMIIEGWCPRGECDFRRVLSDSVESYVDPRGLTYKQTYFLPKQEVAARLFPWYRPSQSQNGHEEPGPLDRPSPATFVLRTTKGERIPLSHGILIDTAKFLVPADIQEQVVSLEIHWEGHWIVPPAPDPMPRNPMRWEQFADDGVRVRFDVSVSKDLLTWTVSEATHGMSVLASFDGGASWRTIFDPKTHSLECVTEKSHEGGDAVIWKQSDTGRKSVSTDGGHTWSELQSRNWSKPSGEVVSIDGGKTFHHPFDPLKACPSKPHTLSLSMLSPKDGVPPLLLFQGTRGMRVFWRIYEVGKGWVEAKN